MSTAFIGIRQLFSCAKSESSANTGGTSCAPAAQTVYSGPGVTVPAQFLGMHLHYWPHCYTSGNIYPEATLSPTPSFGYGTWRSHDYFGGYNNTAANKSNVFQWKNFHTDSTQTSNSAIWNASGSAWSELDSVIQTHFNAGRDIYFTVYGTPAWAARAGFNVSGLAPSSPPQNLNDLQNFITALITRYNTTSVFATKTPIKFLEIWNEPTVRRNSAVTHSGSTLTWGFTESFGYTGAGLPIANGETVFFTSSGSLPAGLNGATQYYVVNTSGANFSVSVTSGGAAISLSGGSGTLKAHFVQNFFWGNSQDMAQMAKTIYQAAKAVDTSITVCSPGFTGGLNPSDNDITSFLNASDGAGGFGKNWIDVLACHPYNTTVDTTTSTPQLSYAIQEIKTLMTTAGLSVATPWLISEQGWMSDNSYMNDTETNQALKIARHAIVSASLGAQKHIFYCYDENFLGAPLLMNSTIKMDRLNWLNQNICGQTITKCEILTDSSVQVTLANGQIYCI